MKEKKNFTQNDALQICFQNLKPSLIGTDDYRKLNVYRSRYEKGTLGQNGIETILTYFGFKKNVSWYKDSEV